MTGCYLRVKRKDKFVDIELEYLTNEERVELFKDASAEEIIKFLNFMCNEYETLLISKIEDYTGEV